MQKKIKQAETCSGLGGEGYFTAGSHRHVPTIAYAWFLRPPHPLSLHSSLSRALQGKGLYFPASKTNGGPPAPLPSLNNPQTSGHHPSPPPSLWERGKRLPLTCCSQVSLAQGSEAYHQQHFFCQPPACL